MENDKLVRLSHAISAAKTGADDWDGGCNIERDRYIEKAFADIHAVDAVEVRHARWVHVATYEMHDKYGGLVGEAFCSECELYSTQLTNIGYVEYDYCPRCGARMDGRREDGDALNREGRID